MSKSKQRVKTIRRGHVFPVSRVPSDKGYFTSPSCCRRLCCVSSFSGFFNQPGLKLLLDFFRKDSQSRRMWWRRVVHRIERERACNPREAAETENRQPGTQPSSPFDNRHSLRRARYRAKG